MNYLFDELRQVGMECPGAWQKILNAGKLDSTHTIIQLDVTELEAIKSECGKPHISVVPQTHEFTTAISPQKPVERENWPTWAIMFSRFIKPGDRGLGDVVERTLRPLGGEAFKKWYERKFGTTCGCTERQIALNNLFPLVSP